MTKKKEPAIKPAPNNAPKVEPLKRIKMKMSLGTPYRAFEKGKTYDVPEHVPMDTATSWVKSGAASKVE